MITHYSFGSITISGKRYRSDLKIINGQVYPDWWRKSGHAVDIEDITDILSAEPDYLVIGAGSPGLMKVSDRLKQHLGDIGVELIAEPSEIAIQIFNQKCADGKNIAAGFHLTC